jgi:hypothetical protein
MGLPAGAVDVVATAPTAVLRTRVAGSTPPEARWQTHIVSGRATRLVGAGGLPSEESIRVPVLWAFVVGVTNVVLAWAFWWLDLSTFHALAIVLIAAVYIGFAVADGRAKVIAVEVAVASVFVVLAASAVTGTAWLLVVAYAGHGFKDLWQHRHHFVANTRWWPPFCATIDWLVAGILVVLIAAGVEFH